ncbi:MAG: DUF4159 domain-containing protein [Candidatus Hydrogenedentes bacterium]|nr:DUF4159 domain-containing protein [Candidatus Hydrogenedentota bacterium]
MKAERSIALTIGLGLALLLCVPPDDVFAQRGRGGWDPYEPPARDIYPSNTFTFCRIEYTSKWGWGRRGGRWRTDYPDSDLNFSERLSELTTIAVNRTRDGRVEHVVVRLEDEDLYHYPFIYMIEVGDLDLANAEADRLRDYLLRGGFLMVDDFWGEDEWQNWEMEFAKVFPPEEYPMFEIPLSHPIYNCVFPVHEAPQIPSIHAWLNSGETFERWDGQKPHYWGVNDKDGRLMAVICHNTDLGDGWERESENHQYFEEFSVKKAYPMGINIVVYAMTH